MIYLNHEQLSKLLGLPTFEEWKKMTDKEKYKFIEERKKGAENAKTDI